MFDHFEVGIFASFSLLLKKIQVSLFARRYSMHIHIYTHMTKHTDSSCTVPMKAFQQVAVIRGRDRERVSEESQQALRQ